MIRKIVLSNFMAHARTELILSEGVNVLVGPNNVGKSSIAVALKILARNSNSQFVMRHGQKECSILVETSEGHILQWVKRKSPSYLINGQVKDRLGRGGTPPELDDTLRLAPIEFEDKDFEPHFGDQKSPIFLINRSPSQIAQFFSTTSDAERLVAMQRLHQKNRAQAQTQHKLLSDMNATLQASVDALSEVPSVLERLDELQTEREQIIASDRSIVEIHERIVQFAKWSLECSTEERRSSLLQTLMPVPTMHPTDFLQSVVDRLETLQIDCLQAEESIQGMIGLAPLPMLEPTRPLENFLSQYSSLICDAEQAADCCDATAAITPPPHQPPTDELEQTIKRLDQLSQDSQRSESLVFASSPLIPPPSELDLSGLQDFIRELAESESYLADNQLQMAQVSAALNELELEIAAWLQSDPKCTYCGAVLTSDSIRHIHHHHDRSTSEPHTGRGDSAKAPKSKTPKGPNRS
jgi:exonuclease SbcC